MPRPRMKRNDPRINIAFYEDNLEFLRHAAWLNHMSITQYVNRLITADKPNYNPADWKNTGEGEMANV